MTGNVIKFTKPVKASMPEQLLEDLRPTVPELVSLVVVGFTKDGAEVCGWCSEDMAMTSIHLDTVKARILQSFMEAE